MDWELAVGIVGVIVGLLAAYFAYVPIKQQLWSRRERGTIPVAPDSDKGYDVFVSYAPTDAPAAEKLAGRLRAEGLRVFLAEWIDVGLVELLEEEKALLGSSNGVLLFSRAAMGDPKIRDEYAAIVRRAHSGARRFVPVLIEDVDLPPFAEIRKPLDLRAVGKRDYDARIADLVRAIRPPRPDLVV